MLERRAGKEMTTATIIVAAGRGKRAGGDLPKQWQMLTGKPVLGRTIDAFRKQTDVICVVLHPDDHDLWNDFGLEADAVVNGGATRDESVRAGLLAVKDHNPSKVLVHDAARPLVSKQTIQRVLDALEEHPGAAPALPVTDALWRSEGTAVDAAVSREHLYRAQTPQGFNYAQILEAHLDQFGEQAPRNGYIHY